MKDSGYFLYSPTRAFIIVVRGRYHNRRRHVSTPKDQIHFGREYIEKHYGAPAYAGQGGAEADDMIKVPMSSALTPTTPRYMCRSYTPEENMSDGVAIVSGGMDSITMVYMLVREFGLHPHLVSFDYGQRHSKELNFALWNAERLGLRWSLVDLTSITDLIASSALTSRATLYLPEGEHKHDIEVPDGHYAQDNMAITVVPNRNMMMMSIAAAIAVSNKGHYLAAGMHAGDHYQYPDCRPTFVRSFNETVRTANDGFLEGDFDLKTPFIHMSKNDIAATAYRYGVPLDHTWSCYKGGEYHCGRCGTCVERLEAIDSVVEAPPGWDQTLYVDNEFWKRTVEEGPQA